MRKIFVSTITAALLLVILASATLAAPATEEKQLLLKGSWDAVEIARGIPPNVLVSGSGSANATQLGLYTVSYQLQVNVPPGLGSGFSQFVAAVSH